MYPRPERHASEARSGKCPQQIDQVATFPVLDVPKRQDTRDRAVRPTKVITHSVGADRPLPDFPKPVLNSAGADIHREPSHPTGNQPSMVMRSAKR